MTESKDLFLSKSTWGAILILVGPLLSHFGLEIGNHEALIESLVSLSGVIIFIVGQFTRKKEINSIAGVKVKKNA